MKVLYFAWIRERIGTEEEYVDAPPATVGALIDQLCEISDGHAAAFQDRHLIRVALDQELSDHEAPLDGVREVAFFPPMTGG